MTKIFGSIFTIALITVLVVAGLSFFSLPLPVTIKLYSVISQSMQPSLSKGDLIVVQKQNTYNNGDIVTFYNPESYKKTDTVTHRIVTVYREKGNKFYKTKGDANNIADSWKISDTLIHGALLFKISYLGSLVTFSKTPYGFLLLIVLPAIIVIASEINEIKEEIRKRKNAV